MNLRCSPKMLVKRQVGKMSMSLAWLSPCTIISPYKSNIPTHCSCCYLSSSSQVDLPSSLTTSSATTIRPAIILPGLGSNTNDYEKLALILPIVMLGSYQAVLLSIKKIFWPGTSKELKMQSVKRKKLAQGGNGTLSFTGHSPGEWLARVYMQCHFELNITNTRDTITATVSETVAQTMLSLTSNQIYENVATQREPLSIVRTNQQFVHRLFRLQLQKLSYRFPNQTPCMLAVTSFTEAENPVVQTLSSPMAPGETGKKQKVEPRTLAKKA